MNYSPYRIPHKPPVYDKAMVCSKCEVVGMPSKIYSQFMKTTVFWIRLSNLRFLTCGVAMGLTLSLALTTKTLVLTLGFAFCAVSFLCFAWYVYVNKTAIKGLDLFVNSWWNSRVPSKPFPLANRSKEVEDDGDNEPA